MSTITIRQLIETCRDDEDPDWPRDTVFCLSGVIRSFAQRETSTYEGDLESVCAWVAMNGKPSAESIEKFMTDHPGIMAIEVPMSVVEAWLTTED